MFEYFPGNYVRNLSVLITLQNGGTIGEVDEACRPIREAAASGADAGTEQFFAAWSAVADRLIASAQEDEERGWTLSAGDKYRRAALYLLNAERMQSVHKPDRLAHYQRAIDLRDRAVRLARDPVEIVEVPNVPVRARSSTSTAAAPTQTALLLGNPAQEQLVALPRQLV